jgi:hypothetical protein
VLDILERVRIKSMIMLNIRAYNSLTAIQLLLLADVQRKLAASSLRMCLNTLAISFRSLTAVLGLLMVMDIVVYHSVCST